MGARLQNQLQDGCGPYGRHLTGAAPIQFYFGGDASNSQLIMTANIDNMTAIRPPSADILVDAITCDFKVAGDATSLFRAALYDMETFPGGTLIGAAAEIAGTGANTKVMPIAAVTLKRNGRYAVLFCASGVTLPALSVATPGYGLSGATWLGCYSNGQSVGGLLYTRAYGAFPAIYNGVYSGGMSSRFPVGLRLP